MRPFYTFPLQTDQLTKKKRHGLCQMKEAVGEHIHLILKTHLKEYRYNYDYGCFVWDQDFNNIFNMDKWEKELETQIQDTIKKYEKRLDGIYISVKVKDPESDRVIKDIPHRLKRMINITISGTMLKTRELFQHQEVIYFSPLSIH